MKKQLNSVRLSARGLTSVPVITACGMLLALKVVLGLFTVNVSSLLKIGFSFLPIAVAGLLFGPVAGGIVGAAGDVVSYFISPTGPYFPGFTLNAFLSGFLYGAVLFRKPVRLWRVFSAKASVTVLVSLLLNPLWLSVLYGKGFIAVFSTRVVTNLVMLPVEAAMLFIVLKVLEKAHVPQFGRNS